MTNNPIQSNTSLKEISTHLLEIGSLLMASGASTNRIRVTLERLGDGLGYDTEILITHRTVFLVVKNTEAQDEYNSFKKTPPHGVNFKLVSGISKMSWHVIENHWSLHQIKEEVNRLKKLPRYSLLYTMIFVSLADASFCRLFGGEYVDMATTFTATCAAFLVRHFAIQFKFNVYLSILFASFTACLVPCFAKIFGFGTHPDLALATAVLFLVPGVPLINSFSDLMDGHIMNGIARGTHAVLIAFSIALGMLMSMLICNF